MKNLILLGLLVSSTVIYAEHHEQHGMDTMHSHEGHIHNEMVNGKTLEVDAQRFDQSAETTVTKPTWIADRSQFGRPK